MMTCHLSIRPAATCTVPRTQLLAASRRHMAASYWTPASDVAPTSAPVNGGGSRCTHQKTSKLWKRSALSLQPRREYGSVVRQHRSVVEFWALSFGEK
nr:hypothetical protein [Tanacetum cinerariifolium]